MTARLNFAEAQGFLTTAYNLDWDDMQIERDSISARLVGADSNQVRRDVESYLAQMDREILADSISIESDHMDDPAVEIVTIKIGL